jgi:hypothetical protein
MVVAVEPSMSTDTVVVPDTENGLETKVRVASLTQNGKPTVPPLEDDELELAPEDEELLLDEPQHANSCHPVSIAWPLLFEYVK